MLAYSSAVIASVVGFLLGIVSLLFFSKSFSQFLPPHSVSLFLVVLFLLVFILTLIFFKIKSKHLTLFQFLLSLMIGFFWAHATVLSYKNHALPEYIENKPLKVVGTIKSFTENKKNTRFLFQIHQTQPPHLWQSKGYLLLYFEDPPYPLNVGDDWCLTVKVKRPHGYANPGSFDKERHYFFKRIVAEGRVIKNENQILLKKYNCNKTIFDDIWTKIQCFREKIFISILTQLKDSHFSGIIAALVVGEQEKITKQQWEIFRLSGTAHLVAISGLHIGLFASFVFAFTRYLFRWFPFILISYPRQIPQALCAIFASFAYALLAGFTIPTKRALIMVVVFMIHILCRRSVFGFRSYFLALGLLLAVDPLCCLSMGFWLSFVAVGVILYGLQNRIDLKNLNFRFVRAQWVSFVGLAPLTLLFFKQISWISPLANSIAIPWVSMGVVPFALLGGLLSPYFPKISVIFLSLADTLFSFLWPILETCVENLVPKNLGNFTSTNAFEISSCLLGAILLLAPKGFPAKKAGLIFLLPLFMHQNSVIPARGLHFTLLDVGQGLSAVIETSKHMLIFDTGPRLNEHSNAGDSVIVPFFSTKNIEKIDMIMVSHGDNDHAGGLEAILKKYLVKKILTSDPQSISFSQNKNKNKMVLQSCYAGQKWHWDGVEFEVLHPSSNTSISVKNKKKNENSCVLKVTAGEHAILLTGDIEKTAEHHLIASDAKKLSSSILIVPHHGSKTSSSKEFVQAVKPKYAIIPFGYKNNYGHPHFEVVERYHKAGSIILDPVKSGSISFILDPNKPLATPKQYRIDHHYPWND